MLKFKNLLYVFLIITSQWTASAIIASADHGPSKRNLQQQTSPITYPKKQRILLMVLEPANDPFWTQVINFSRIVAESLNIELNIHIITHNEQHRDRYIQSINRMDRMIVNIFKPDLIIGRLWKNLELALLELSQKHQIPLITYNSQLKGQIISRIGKPRQDYSLWLAHLSPDNIDIGKQVSELLIKSIQGKYPIEILAITESPTSDTIIDRIAGLQLSLSHRPQITLMDVIYRSPSKLAKPSDSLLKIISTYQFNAHNLIWTANESTLHEVIKNIERHPTISFKDVRIGTVGWNQNNLSYIRERKIAFSVGGHFVEGGKAILLAHELLNGFDFSNELGTTIPTHTKYITAKNLSIFESKITPIHWQNINFKSLSKYYNPKRQYYQLSLEYMLGLETKHINQLRFNYHTQSDLDKIH